MELKLPKELLDAFTQLIVAEKVAVALDVEWVNMSITAPIGSIPNDPTNVYGRLIAASQHVSIARTRIIEMMMRENYITTSLPEYAERFYKGEYAMASTLKGEEIASQLLQATRMDTTC